MNMSYCAFENTLKDLYQILDVLNRTRSWEELTEGASEHEVQAMRSMPALLDDLHERFQCLRRD